MPLTHRGTHYTQAEIWAKLRAAETLHPPFIEGIERDYQHAVSVDWIDDEGKKRARRYADALRQYHDAEIKLAEQLRPLWDGTK